MLNSLTNPFESRTTNCSIIQTSLFQWTCAIVDSQSNEMVGVVEALFGGVYLFNANIWNTQNAQ